MLSFCRSQQCEPRLKESVEAVFQKRIEVKSDGDENKERIEHRKMMDSILFDFQPITRLKHV